MLFNLKVCFFIDAYLILGLLVARWALIRSAKPAINQHLVTLLLLTPPIALLGGYLFLFFVYLIAVVAFGGRSRVAVCVTFMAMLSTVPELYTETGFAGVYIMPFSSSLMMTIGGLIGFAVGRGPINRRIGWQDGATVFLILLFGWMDSRGLSGTSVARFMLFHLLMKGGPYLFLSRSLTTRDDIERTLLAFCLAGTAVACVGLFEGLRSWVLYQNYYGAMHLPLPMGSAMTNVRGGHLRVPGTPIDPTAFGYMLVVFLCALGAVRHYFHRNGFRLVVALILCTLLLTQARGAWLGGIFAWSAISFYRRHFWRPAAALIFALFGRDFMGLLVSSNGRLSDSLGFAGSGASTIDYRRLLFDSGMEQVRGHPWLGQSGVDLLKNMQSLQQGQHIVDFVNTHLYIAMGGGIPAFLIWALIWAGLICTMFMTRQRWARAGYRQIGGSILGIVAAAMPILTFTSLIDRNVTWLILALALSAACVRQVGRAASGNRRTSPVETMPVTAVAA